MDSGVRGNVSDVLLRIQYIFNGNVSDMLLKFQYFINQYNTKISYPYFSLVMFRIYC